MTINIDLLAKTFIESNMKKVNKINEVKVLSQVNYA